MQKPNSSSSLTMKYQVESDIRKLTENSGLNESEKIEFLEYIYLIQAADLSEYSTNFTEKVLPTLDFPELSSLHRLLCKDNRLNLHQDVIKRFIDCVVSEKLKYCINDTQFHTASEEIKKCSGISLIEICQDYELFQGQESKFYVNRKEIESAIDQELTDFNCKLLTINQEVIALGIIRESLNIYSLFEEFLSRLDSPPKLFGHLFKTFSNKPYLITFIEKPESNLKDEISSFNKLPKPAKALLMPVKQKFVLKVYKKIISDIILYKTLNIIVKSIIPENVFKFKQLSENDGPNIILITKLEQNYKLVENKCVVNYFPIKTASNLRYLAPEIVNTDDYKKRMKICTTEFDSEKSLIWAITAISLHTITDQNVDNWNHLNFTKTREKIINSCIKDKRLKAIMIRSMDLDFRMRPTLDEASQILSEVLL